MTTDHPLDAATGVINGLVLGVSFWIALIWMVL